MSRDDGDKTWKELSSFFHAAQQMSLAEAVAGYGGDGHGGDGYDDGRDDGGGGCGSSTDGCGGCGGGGGGCGSSSDGSGGCGGGGGGGAVEAVAVDVAATAMAVVAAMAVEAVVKGTLAVAPVGLCTHWCHSQSPVLLEANVQWTATSNRDTSALEAAVAPADSSTTQRKIGEADQCKKAGRPDGWTGSCERHGRFVD